MSPSRARSELEWRNTRNNVWYSVAGAASG